jgi:caffeoyl-CoA O-methyltransferase
MTFEEQEEFVRHYITQNFAAEDEPLSTWAEEAQKAGLPLIQVSPVVGKMLQTYLKAIQAKRVLEIGTLGGYSGTWIARGLPEGGKLITLELEPKHRDFAQAMFQRAGVADKVEIRLGAALDTLPTLESEERFDFIFIDADKGNYPNYLDWAFKLVRPGGIIAGDNALAGKNPELDNPDTENAHVKPIQTFNRRMATDPRLTSVILPIRDGVCLGIFNP